MNNPKVSIIVPVYNVEKYLRQCLDSIAGQTLVDLEILLINDGSKDGSLEIINEYAEKDRRVKVMDKPNEGYGKTMNRGIAAASGEYIGIVESDDWIEADMYETLYRLAKSHRADVVKAGFYFFDAKTGKDKKVLGMPEHITGQVIIPRYNTDVFYIMPSIWSAIYRRDFLNENEILFLESPGASFQDTAFNFKVWAMAGRAWLTMTPLVHYRTGHTGQSVASQDKVFCVCDEHEEMERYMASHPVLFGKLEKIFNRMKCNTYLWNLKRLDARHKETFRKRMQAELIPALKRDAMDLTGMTNKGRLKLWKTLYPESVWLKILYTLENLTRLLRNYCKVVKLPERLIRHAVIRPLKVCFAGRPDTDAGPSNAGDIIPLPSQESDKPSRRDAA